MKTLLVVDDTPEDREVLTRIFQDQTVEGYQTIEAWDAGSCFENLEKSPKIDCLLLDYSMPGQDGLNLLSDLLERYPSVPIIMVTGHGSEHIAVDALKLGAQDYIVKNSFSGADIRHRVDVAIAHKDMERRLARQQQSLRDFADILVHDLRAPLRSIKGPIELLTQGDAPLPDEAQTRLFEFITDSVEQMDNLILSLQEFSELAPPEQKFELFCPSILFEHVQKALAHDIEATGTILTLQQKVDKIWGDPQLLTQLLQNLVDNALKYRRNLGSQVEILVDEIANKWRLVISDNGIGIAQENLTEIFEPFKRLHGRSKYKGTGLGLAICMKIAEQHNAHLICQSELGQWSKFSLSLPKPSVP